MWHYYYAIPVMQMNVFTNSSHKCNIYKNPAFPANVCFMPKVRGFYKSIAIKITAFGTCVFLLYYSWHFFSRCYIQWMKWKKKWKLDCKQMFQWTFFNSQIQLERAGISICMQVKWYFIIDISWSRYNDRPTWVPDSILEKMML